MSVVLHTLSKLLCIEVYYLTQVVVRAGFARTTSASACMELSAICAFRRMTVVFLFYMRIQGGVR